MKKLISFMRLFIVLALLLPSSSLRAATELEVVQVAFDQMEKCGPSQLQCADSYLEKIRNIKISPRDDKFSQFLFTIYAGAWMLDRARIDRREAEVEYRRALSISERHYDELRHDICHLIPWLANANLSALYIEEKRYAEALPLLSDALATIPKSAVTLSTQSDRRALIFAYFGDVYLGMRQYDEAEKQYLYAKDEVLSRAADWDLTHWEGWIGQTDEIRPDALAKRMVALAAAFEQAAAVARNSGREADALILEKRARFIRPVQ